MKFVYVLPPRLAAEIAKAHSKPRQWSQDYGPIQDDFPVPWQWIGGPPEWRLPTPWRLIESQVVPPDLR
jgi:hypothetical protein